MIKIEITNWDNNKSWAGWSDKKKRFVHLVQERSNMNNTEIKRLVRSVLNKETFVFTLDRISKPEEAVSIRHFLESSGASVEVQKEP